MHKNEPLLGRAQVLEKLPDHPAIKAILSWDPQALTDAAFDHGELTLTIAPALICVAAEKLKACGYNFLEDLTAVDLFPSSPRFRLVYQLLSLSAKSYLRLCVLLQAADPVVDSMTAVWPSANFYEREVFDLFGIRFNNHPNLLRIMLPDEWEGHPLRKDYPVEGYR